MGWRSKGASNSRPRLLETSVGAPSAGDELRRHAFPKYTAILACPHKEEQK